MAELQDHSTVGASPLDFSTTSNADEYSSDPRFIESQRELRTLLFDTARSTGPTRAGTPVSTGHEAQHIIGMTASSSTATTGGCVSLINSIVSTGKRVAWLKNYINEVASWLDMFDKEQTFGVHVPILAKTSASLTYAILAISARQMEREKNLHGDCDSLQLYQEAIKYLTPQLQMWDANIMATCVILCCLEMMSAAPKNWRRHLDGCAALFDAYAINGFSTGLPQAVFWCYARMDLCAAIISEGEQSTVLAVDKWLPATIHPSQAESYFRSFNIPDMYANYSVWLCAKVCELAWILRNEHEQPEDRFAGESFIHSWNNIWLEVQRWKENRPPALIELDSVEKTGRSQSSPFPFILFAANCAISSNQLYHCACLLLLDIKPPLIKTGELGQAGSSIWHAHRICGISATNEHHGCLNNAIQPLWLAGKLLSHPVEHKAVVDLIQRIETITGWCSTWRIKDLKNLWGYTGNDPLF